MKSKVDWEIRLGTPADAGLLTELEAKCFDYSRIGKRSFQRLLTSKSAHIHLVTNQQTLLGYSLLLTRSNSTNWRLYSIAMAPEARGQGIAKALMEHIIEYARTMQAQSMSLEVKSDNRGAIALYEQLDFAVVDVLVQYYDDGTDGYRMRRPLSPSTPV
ncbi:[SSU ribosomal protein S18P]-alanine acetyltransferase [Pseudidiomarina planktonica]|uniref:[SSU ribosomal protein S18P]-alanine acetyltransferase n=1 Tax=Pseudidiomarina planktonica TaxID=1323738 RepID=A0A1Y6G381_9GAMM|nr:N-acetyltransferase [Pseudidiomarina planktonica]RUO63372.1 N-acetyltransferase [Pseudidiomarina planktonica]SMQ80400.1 [SSU ribosomal protein S18P]-alanine acetyltransferase [Pseudidiomarina planktonica]